MTEKARLSGACTVHGCRNCQLENPLAFIPRTEYEESSLFELADATLPGKASKLQVVTDRTVNRHWWVSRQSAKALERTRVKELCKLIP